MKTFSEWVLENYGLTDRDRQELLRSIKTDKEIVFKLAKSIWFLGDQYSKEMPAGVSPESLNKLLNMAEDAADQQNDVLLQKIELSLHQTIKELQWKLDLKNGGTDSAYQYSQGSGSRVIKKTGGMT